MFKILFDSGLLDIAFADNSLEFDEEHFDKVTELLFIPHAEVLNIKNRIRKGYAGLFHLDKVSTDLFADFCVNDMSM